MKEQMTLGEIADALKAASHDLSVRFDFCGLKPTDLDSWRGDYSMIAFGWTKEGEFPKAGELAKKCSAAIGQTFQGYKGGDFTMSSDTPVWVSNYGYSNDTAVVGVRVEMFEVIIETTAKEYGI